MSPTNRCSPTTCAEYTDFSPGGTTTVASASTGLSTGTDTTCEPAPPACVTRYKVPSCSDQPDNSSAGVATSRHWQVAGSANPDNGAVYRLHSVNCCVTDPPDAACDTTATMTSESV